MPNRLFQGIVNQMREAIDRNIGVVDETGTVIACSELGLIGEIRKGVISAGVFSTNQTCVDNATYTTFDLLFLGIICLALYSPLCLVGQYAQRNIAQKVYAKQIIPRNSKSNA